MRLLRLRRANASPPRRARSCKPLIATASIEAGGHVLSVLGVTLVLDGFRDARDGGREGCVVLRPAQVSEFAARLDALRAPGTYFSAVRPFRSGDVGMLAKWAPIWSEIETPDTQCQAANTSKLVLNYSVY